jgi:multidrug efflux pump subunit AcrB
MARPEISQLRVWGQRKPEIRIEIEPYLLERHDLTIKQIVGIIQQASLRFQAGTLKTEGGDIVLRADDLAHFGGDYRDISLLEIRDGSKVRLDDIATITDGYGDEEIVARFDGNPTVGMEVLIAQRENLLQISKAVRETITDFEPQLPPEIQIASWGDSAGYISERLSLLRTNAFQGLLLVTVILAIFLNARLRYQMGRLLAERCDHLRPDHRAWHSRR